MTADVTATSGSVANSATVAAPTGVTDPDGTNNSATDTDTVTPAPVVADLAITKTDGTTAVDAGGSTTYTLTVTNNGPSTVTGAILADPAVTGLAKTGVACARDARPVLERRRPWPQLEGGTFALPALAAGQTYGLSVTADVTATSGSVSQQRHGRRADRGDRPGRHQQQRDRQRHGHPGPGVADLAITKDDGTTAVDAGGSTTYTLTVTNNGPSTVSGAILGDPVATGLAPTGVACSATPGECSSAPTLAQLQAGFALPALAAGQSYGLSLTADVTATSGSLANSATVAAPTGVTDPDPSNNSATDSDTVGNAGGPGLTLAKSASPTTYTAAGDVIAYSTCSPTAANVALGGPFTVADDKASVAARRPRSSPSAPRSPAPRPTGSPRPTSPPAASRTSRPRRRPTRRPRTRTSATVRAQSAPIPDPLGDAAPHRHADDRWLRRSRTSWLAVLGIMAGLLAAVFVLTRDG